MTEQEESGLDLIARGFKKIGKSAADKARAVAENVSQEVEKRGGLETIAKKAKRSITETGRTVVAEGAKIAGRKLEQLGQNVETKGFKETATEYATKGKSAAKNALGGIKQYSKTAQASIKEQCYTNGKFDVKKAKAYMREKREEYGFKVTDTIVATLEKTVSMTDLEKLRTELAESAELATQYGKIGELTGAQNYLRSDIAHVKGLIARTEEALIDSKYDAIRKTVLRDIVQFGHKSKTELLSTYQQDSEIRKVIEKQI
jgi:hypothetical protein